jgi:hypothetical protein
MARAYGHGEGWAISRRLGKNKPRDSRFHFTARDAQRGVLRGVSFPKANPHSLHVTATLPRRMARHRLVSQWRTLARRLAVAQRAPNVRRCLTPTMLMARKRPLKASVSLRRSEPDPDVEDGALWFRSPSPGEPYDDSTTPRSFHRRMARHRLVSQRRTIARRLAGAQRTLSVRWHGRLSGKTADHNLIASVPFALNVV